ncbi:MAG: hypothetical protein JEY97_11790 [Bacteroidales bacterium]|nr:hypothetical protein [Bacteroidales bacterium]
MNTEKIKNIKFDLKDRVIDFAIRILSFSAISLFLFSSCQKTEKYSDIPQIEFSGITKIFTPNNIVDKVVLKIAFTDGDGDIGLTQNDTLPPYDYNFFIKYFEKREGEFVEVVLADFSFNARIPILTPEGRNKSIKGEIQDTIIINTMSVYDTIRFETYIVDRALHESNIITTPDVVTK